MRSEVAVIGAGVIGCACAFELASAGFRVTVFDLRHVAQGASQASAGVLAPYIEGHHSGPLRTLGRRSLDLFDGFVQRVTEASGRAIQYTRGGTLEIALEADHADALRRSGDALQREGIAAHWIAASDLRDVEPLATASALGGLRIDMHGFVGVPEFTDALATAAMRAGAHFVLDTRVVSVASTDDQRVVVTTDTGPTVADHAILAAGSWAGQIRIAGLTDSVAVKPVRGQLLHLAWPTIQPLRHVLWGTECYIVPWLNGRVLVGATVEDAGFDERATAVGVRDLLEAGCALVPHLWHASFEEVRVGLRPASPDGLPIVGESSAVPGLIYATGHYRNGVLLTPLTASLVKSLVTGDSKDPAFEILRPSRLGRL
ncbi:MAG TPA: glycine oxidase ThiO [Vicinamibacterales bacterium]|nr:glycine oxidase ThiO [Vicinamibacterales bacterium]